MKVLHIIEIRGIGGAETLLLDLLPRLKNNIAVECLFIHRKKHKESIIFLEDKLKKEGIKVTCLTFSNFLSLTYNLKKLIVNAECNIIHAHLTLSELLVSLLKLVGSINEKIIATIHGFADDRKQHRLRLFFKRRVYGSYNGLIYTSNFILNFFEKDNFNVSSSITVINNGIAILPEIGSQYEKSIINENCVKLVLPGRLTELKGHTFAIDTIHILSKKYPNIVLDIYGSGPFQDNITKEIETKKLKQYVNLKGFSHQLEQVLKEYDIILIPSLFESFGMIFLEGFNSGKPVVAFDLPAGNEIIKHGYNGRLAKPYSSASLAEEIDYLIQNPLERSEIIFNAKKELQEKYSIQKMAASYLSFYQKILSN